jgi:uncharacterized protein
MMPLQYKVNDRMRHRRAFEASREPASAADLASFDGARQCLLVTFKRSGERVPTPVNFGIADGRLYFRSEPHVAKVKRLRRNPRVRVCPCTFRGKPTGPLVEGTARVLPESEGERAYSIIASNYRAEMKLVERTYDLTGVPQAYVEVTPVG